MSSSNLPALSPPQRAFYGVQFSDTAFRHWEFEGEDRSRLIYHFEDVGLAFRGTLQNTLIAVTKAYPDAGENEIKKIASTIKQAEKIAVYDPIFGVESQSIRRFGFISDKSIDDRVIVFNIEWVDEGNLRFGFVEGSVFKEDAELQMLSRREFRAIEKQYSNELQLAYQHMPETMLGDSLDYRIAEPEVHRIRGIVEKEQQALKEAKIDQGGTVRLFYGTNRNRLDLKDGIQHYGSAETRELKYGVCDVSIPRKHKLGKLERPNALERFVSWPASVDRHYIIENAGELSEADFLADLIARLNEKSKKQALLFIHGYANTFDDAAYRAAQLAWDLPFKGCTGFYSWPSSGTKSAYGNDEAAARSSAPMLKEFIGQIAGLHELEQLHIIAHSMGGLILTLSLNILASDASKINELEKICQLVLGAPDIDKNEFFNIILPGFSKLGKQRTLYASDHDFALNVSASLRSLRDRLGQIGTNIFVAQGVDTINASNLKTSNSHGYLFDGRDLLGDLFQIINSGSIPEDRRLREIEFTPLNYWLFPE